MNNVKIENELNVNKLWDYFGNVKYRRFFGVYDYVGMKHEEKLRNRTLKDALIKFYKLKKPSFYLIEEIYFIEAHTHGLDTENEKLIEKFNKQYSYFLEVVHENSWDM